MAKSKLFDSPGWLLPGEEDMLAGVVENLAADLPKLVYADWLEERGDPRGPFLRQFIDWRRGNGECPDSDVFSRAWCELVGVRLVLLLREHGLTEFADRLLGFAKPALDIQAQYASEESYAKLPVGGSQLGGLPSLPSRRKWPRCQRGPLMFLAQFNLADFQPTISGRMLPKSGLLSLFQYRDFSKDIQGQYDDGGLLVIHSPKTTGLAILEPPDDLTDNNGRPKAAAKLTFEETLDLPSRTEPWEEKLGIPGELSEAYWNVLWEQRMSKHALFGYARPRHIIRDPIPGPEWQQFITFESDDELGWGWGDGHEFFWYIRTADLLAGKFDDTRGYDG